MHHLPRAERIKASIAMVAAVIVWGSAFVAIRSAMRYFSPGELSFARLLTASVLLGGIVLARGGIRIPQRRDWLAMFGLGALGHMAYQILLNTGERSVDAGTSSLLIAFAPMLASVMAVLLLGERLTALGWLGTAIAFTGAAIIAVGSGISLNIGPGVLTVCAAALIWAVYLVLQKTIASRYDSLEMTAWPMWVGTLLLLPWAGTAPAAIKAAPFSATMSVLWLGVACSVIGFLCWSYAIKRVAVTVGSTALYTVPVAAFTIGVLFLHEMPHASALLGGAIAIAGVALAQLKGRPATAGAQAAATGVDPVAVEVAPAAVE